MRNACSSRRAPFSLSRTLPASLLRSFSFPLVTHPLYERRDALAVAPLHRTEQAGTQHSDRLTQAHGRFPSTHHCVSGVLLEAISFRIDPCVCVCVRANRAHRAVTDVVVVARECGGACPGFARLIGRLTIFWHERSRAAVRNRGKLVLERAMWLPRVRVAAVASALLPQSSTADGLLAAPRRSAAREVRQRRRVNEGVVGPSTDTGPLRTDWRKERWPAWTRRQLIMQTDDIGTMRTCGCVREVDAAATATSLANGGMCTRSPLAHLRAPCAALETPCRCCASLTGVRRAPPSPSHNSPQSHDSHRRRLLSDSPPSSTSRYKKRARQHRQGTPATVVRYPRPLRANGGDTVRLQAPEDGHRDASPPSKPEEVSVADDVDGASAADGGMGGSAEDGSASPAAAAHETRAGWGLEDVNSRTGRTKLEELYERNLDRIRAILEQPLPAMPPDGSIDPDFFVGFASYSYQLRDQYRATLARELQVPVTAVRLSVAWSGRFDVRRFGRVQKVCGVCLDRQVLLAATHHDRERNPRTGLDCKGGDSTSKTRITEDDESSSSSASALPLPETLQKRIHALVAAINGRRRDDLMQMSFFQASPPIPEVSFALTRQEHRLLFHLHTWIRRHVLQSAAVVVVYGVPPPPPSTTPTDARETSHTPRRSTDSPERNGATRDTSDAGRDDTTPQDPYAQWQRLCRTCTTSQRREVQDKWLRLLHRRKVVPLMISLTALATEVAAAVVRGEVPHMEFQHVSQGTVEVKQAGVGAVQNGGEHSTAFVTSSPDAAPSLVPLSASLKDVLTCIEAVSASSPPFTTDHDGASAEDKDAHAMLLRRAQDVIAPQLGADTAEAATPLFRPTSTSQKAETMRWVRLVYQALLLRETQNSADCSSRMDAEQSSMRVANHAPLPALFAQGVYAGGQEEVAYLQRNRAAMDALLLRPHEISFKRKFLSRMRNGHRRLRMEDESAAPYSMNG
ncbi:hypothetical protein, conserved [Leishmania tarentolae]|uniref:Uncharacterized protein n=1 Tax=Leishmania tarentolae TaxID=5689 RepID=A0A640KHH7_LEITA|nr:hypothetical protein, conserved [Leishmania tarentolae]